ncbi:ABC transporter substrate-binding protein [Brevibacillus massiliensis]|jgi:putative ABC transport system substrate-binding protein|uniref:ABC transporter substrate-binding protein n=1 Tax=Brevibacillus massiliensis TaxID=1118054 RepID=UPI00037E9E3A|nr:ABC transporter substrate-binding protein [Brevibacillus massiliensis]
MFASHKKRNAMMVVFFALMLLFVTACGQQSTGAPEPQQGQEANSGGQAEAPKEEAKPEKPLKIGIVQIIEHPALDAAREGFIAEMTKLGYEKGKDVVYDIKSAQGNMDTAISIAQKFQGDNVDMIFAIATQAAQASAQVTKDIPILFTAVTDPVAVNVVASMDKPGGNVTGTTDMNPVEEQLQLIKEIKADAKKVGIIYSAGEVNSKVQVDLAKTASSKLGLEIVEAAISNVSEVKQAAESLVGKVDAIYIPTDNVVVASIAAVLKVAEAQKIPVIAGEENTVKSGAITTYGIDYGKLGEQTADMADKIFKGQAKPADMPVEKQADMKLIINKKAAERMGVTLPQSLLDRAQEVIEQ